MTNASPSDRSAELAAGYVLQNLSAEETAELEELLANHPELVQSVSELQEILDYLPCGLTRVPPPSMLRSTVLAAATEPAPVPRPQRVRYPWQILTALFGLVLVGLGSYSYRLQQALESAQTQIAQQERVITVLQQPQTRLVSLTGIATSASGSVIVEPTQQTLAIAVQDLAPVPVDQVYRLWAVIDSQKILCAEFRPDTTGSVVQQFATTTAACSATTAQLVVTREPLPAPPQPVGPPVLAAQAL